MIISKKSSVSILSLGLMLLVAGYINYKYNPDREKDLGQTVYVNGKDSFTYDVVSIYDDEAKMEEVEEVEECINCNNEIEELSAETEEENVVAVFKYDRDNMFSELSENYTQMINNTNTSNEKVNEYQDKLNELKIKKNLILMVENVIKSNGIDDVVIIPTENSNYNIIIKSEKELKDEDVAKIQQILVDQLGADANKITITCKK